MDQGDSEGVGGQGDKGKGQNSVKQKKERQEDDRAEQIEEKMHGGNALGVSIRSDGADQRGDTSADILPHDDGKGSADGDLSRGGEGLQDAHGGRGAL